MMSRLVFLKAHILKDFEVYNYRIVPRILFSLDDLYYLNVVFSLRKFARHAVVVVVELKLAASTL